MHLARSRIAHHADDFAAGSAAHDGIVDQDDPLAFQQTAHRIQLQLHSEVAHRLFWLDEGAAHVVIANQTKAEGNAALRRITHGRGHA